MAKETGPTARDNRSTYVNKRRTRTIQATPPSVKVRTSLDGGNNRMTSQLDSKIVSNRSRTLLDFSQLGKGYIKTPLGRKLGQAKISVSNLAVESQTSRADVSHYIHGRFHKIGKARRRQIAEALKELGILRRRVGKPSQCKNCGQTYPTRRNIPIEKCVR